MTNLTAWQGGALNSNSVAFQSAFLAADLASLANLSSVMSSTAFNNATGLDQFMDISFVGAIASSTIAAGAGISLFLAILQGDGATYGDGRLTVGTQAAYSPLLNPLGGLPIQIGTTITGIIGSVIGLVIPPKSFRLVLQNNTGFALAASGNMGYISTYRQNTNAS